LASLPNIPNLFVGHHVYHPYNEIYILMRSATFDTLARPVLLEEVMYNRETFYSWLGRPFQFTVIKQLSSTYKSSARRFNQTNDPIKGE
jgi:hypothetical protein